MDEFARISYWTDHRARAEDEKLRGVVHGIGDDAAVLDISRAPEDVIGDKQLVASVDTMVEQIHFNERTMRDEDVGYKAVAACVSDIAAMGGVPLYALISISVPSTYSADRIHKLYNGIYDCANRYELSIVGGDTTSAPEHLVLSVTVIGAVEAGAALLRSSAQAGHAVFVTGLLGKSAAGLHALSSGRIEKNIAEQQYLFSLAEAHQRPSPSVAAGRILLQAQRSSGGALNDISDGLTSEAWEIAEASGVRIVLEEEQLVCSDELIAYAKELQQDPLQWILYGGEDYMLVGTMNREQIDHVAESFRQAGLPFYIIGFVEAGEPEVELLTSRMKQAQAGQRRIKLAKRGYNHFNG